MTCLVFLVLTHLPKISAIFIMNGIFMVQAVLDLFRVKCWELSGRGIVRCLHAVLENKISRIVGIGLQVGPILAAAGYIGWATKDVMLPVTLPLCLLVISAVWSTGCQRLGTKASARTRPEASAHNWSSDSTKLRSRYKSSMLSSLWGAKLCSLFQSYLSPPLFSFLFACYCDIKVLYYNVENTIVN